jgi:hypothetical protein
LFYARSDKPEGPVLQTRDRQARWPVCKFCIVTTVRRARRASPYLRRAKTSQGRPVDSTGIATLSPASRTGQKFRLYLYARTTTPIRTKGRLAAIPTARSSKYGNARTNLVDLSAINLAPKVTADLEELGRHGLADKTWSTYSTAERMLSKFHKERKLERKLPLTEKTILEFIHWLATDRKLAAGTINSYLAGVRQLHIARGLPEPSFRTEVVKLVLRGIKNKDKTDKMKKNNIRQPITKDLMALLKRRLREWKAPSADQRLIWAVASNLFHG